MSSCPIPVDELAESLRKHVDPGSPPAVRMMAARGMLPMGPKDMLSVLACLQFDLDEKVAASAQKSLQELPDRILLGGVKENLHPQVLDQLARMFTDRIDVILSAILHTIHFSSVFSIAQNISYNQDIAKVNKNLPFFNYQLKLPL